MPSPLFIVPSMSKEPSPAEVRIVLPWASKLKAVQTIRMDSISSRTGLVQLKDIPVVSGIRVKADTSVLSVSTGLEEFPPPAPPPPPPPQAASNRVVKIKLARRVRPVKCLPELSPDAGL